MVVALGMSENDRLIYSKIRRGDECVKMFYISFQYLLFFEQQYLMI